MQQRPWMKFYPADWRQNANLHRCSVAARGTWLDVICVLHDSDEYGIVRWPLSDLVASAKVDIRHVKELIRNNVLKGSDNGISGWFYTPTTDNKPHKPVTLIAETHSPIWYSSRMVFDEWRNSRKGPRKITTSGNVVDFDATRNAK